MSDDVYRNRVLSYLGSTLADYKREMGRLLKKGIHTPADKERYYVLLAKITLTKQYLDILKIL
ncbi:hypothetical protein [Raineya sp.]